MSTNVPSVTLGPTGFIAPEPAANLAGVQADINAALGGGLNPGLYTPQGQLASSIAAIKGDADAQFLAVVSQVDPQYAQGRMQDAIGSLTGMTRFPATSTQVAAVAGGLAGTVIAAGVPVAQDTAGNLYTCPGATIGAGGTVPVLFSNQSTGALPFTGPLTIYQTTPGWDTITSPVLQGLGQPVETQQQFEARRQASVAGNATSMNAAIRAAVLASGSTLTPPAPPTAAYVYDNSTGTAIVWGGITIPANSIYVAAVGGNPAAIAQALYLKKAPGCNYAPSAIFTATCAGLVLTVTAVTSGILAVGQTVMCNGISLGTINSLGTGTGGTGTYNLSVGGTVATGTTMTSATSVIVSDTSYAAPQPQYQVSYTVPVSLPVNIQVTVASGGNPPSNALALLEDAVNGLGQAFTGADGGPAAGIGATIYASRFYQTIAAILPGVSIISVLVGSGSPTANSMTVQINQFPVLGTITLVEA